jgi:hypothetical protein
MFVQIWSIITSVPPVLHPTWLMYVHNGTLLIRSGIFTRSNGVMHCINTGVWGTCMHAIHQVLAMYKPHAFLIDTSELINFRYAIKLLNIKYWQSPTVFIVQRLQRLRVLFINFDHSFIYINVCYCKISIGAFPPNSQHIQGVPKKCPLCCWLITMSISLVSIWS